MADKLETKSPLLSDIDTKVDAIWSALVTRQNAYLASKGRYFQGLKTSATPADGADATPDKTRKPTDQAESWQAAGITFPAKLPMALTIDTYNGPKGQGWVATVEVTIGGRTWRRSKNSGAETWRDRAWADVTPTEVKQ